MNDTIMIQPSPLCEHFWLDASAGAPILAPPTFSPKQFAFSAPTEQLRW